MSTERNACGRFMLIPESYNGTQMFTCAVCGLTCSEKEDFLGDGCQRNLPGGED